MKDKETGKTNDEIDINEIRLDDSNNNNYKFTKMINNETKKQKKKKHFYIPFLPRMYWLFYRRPINFLIFIPSLAEGWTNMATTICMGNIIDAIHKENGLQIVKMNAIYALIASIICAIFTYFNYSMWIIIGDLIGVKIRRLLFKSYMKKDIEFFDKHSIGKLLILLQQDCSSVCDAFTDLKTHQISAIGKFLIAFVVMYSVDFKLATFSFISQIAITYIVKIFRQFGSVQYLKFLEYLSQGVTISDESISNEKVVYSFNRQNEQKRLYDEKLMTAFDHDSKSRFCMRISFLLDDLINDACICVLLNIGAFFVIKNKFSAGELFTLSRAAIWAGKEINHIFDTLTQEQRAIDSSRRIFNIIDYPVDIKDEKDEKNLE